MKKKICIFITSALALIMLSLIFLSLAYGNIPHYTLPENILQLSSAYCDDNLIGLTYDCLYIYGLNDTDTVKLNKHYKKFCAKSKNDIMLIDDNDNVYHYYNGNFEKVDFNNKILDITYIWRSYIFLDDKNDVYMDDELLFSLGTDADARQIAGSLDVSYSIKDIWFVNSDNMLCVYNSCSNEILNIGNFKKYEFVSTGSIYISDEQMPVKITRNNNDMSYEFAETECLNEQINAAAPLSGGCGYLLLTDKKLLRIKQDISGNYSLCNDFKDIDDSFSRGVFRKDLLRDWKIICFTNHIGTADNIFSSPYSDNKTHRIIYIKEDSYIYVYEQ